MTPLRLKDYMTQNGRVTINDVCQYFHIDAGLATQLIRFWMHRNKCTVEASCQDCHLKCQSMEYFVWSE